MRHYTGNRRGQTAIMFTLAIVPLFGMLGLVVDMGWAYFRKQAAQAAADAAAGAAAQAAYITNSSPTCATTHVACYASEYTCPANPSTSPSDNIGNGCLYAKANGFVSSGRQKVTFQSGVGSAPTATSVTISYWVIARVSEDIPQLFSAVLGFPKATVTARATTGTREASAGGCVITLDPTADNSLSISGSAALTSGCGVFVNSNSSSAINTNGGGRITTTPPAKTQIVGGCNGCANISPAAQTGVPTMTDPFADLAPPSYSGCGDTSNPVNLGSHDTRTISAGVFCSGLIVGAQSQLTLNAGTYVIKNGISIGGQASIRSNGGVTLYIQSGGISMAGGASVSLSAPTSGSWQGILFYQDRADTTDSTLVGGTGQLMNGVLYFPSAHLTYTGGSNVDATQTTIVAKTASMVGNSYIQAAATTTFTGISGGAFLIE
jgi:hypothetical protein